MEKKIKVVFVYLNLFKSREFANSLEEMWCKFNDHDESFQSTNADRGLQNVYHNTHESHDL